MSTEIWKDIENYEGRYQVSNLGNVKSLKRKVLYGHSWRIVEEYYLKQRTMGTCKYLSVALTTNWKGKRFLIHRLVAKAFPEICGEWFEGCEVNHKDENKMNNAAENLEVCTGAYNKRYGTASKRTAMKNTNGKMSKPVLQFDMNGNFIKEYPSVAEARRVTGATNVSNAARGISKQSGGFIWKYA